MRTCVTCGAVEDRRTDPKGRTLTNLDPVSGKCLRCLTASVRAKRMPPAAVPFDVRHAQMPIGDRDE